MSGPTNIRHVTPERGDAIQAFCPETSKWMGGIIDSVNIKEGWVWIVAGKNDLHASDSYERNGTACWLTGCTFIREGKAYKEVYRDTDSCVYQEQDTGALPGTPGATAQDVFNGRRKHRLP